MKCLLAQINTTVGDVAGNGERVLRLLAERGRDVDLIVFPELTLTGYHPLDLLHRPGFLARVAAMEARIREATRNLRAAVVVGSVRANPGSGRPFHNLLLVFAQGEEKLAYAKRLLPTDDVFEEARHFEPGREPGLLTLAGLRVGFLVCEDGWAGEAGDPHGVDPVAELAAAGARMLVSINASPGGIGKVQTRLTRFGRAARRHALPFLYLNLVGGNDETVFDGASFALDARGQPRLLLPGCREAVEEVSARQLTSSGQVLGMLADEETYLLDLLGLGLGDFLAKNGLSRVVVGVSGGLDSALVAALARRVLPTEAVAAVAMPSRYSSGKSLILARRLCTNLGVKLHVAPIDDGLSLALDGFRRAFGEETRDLPRENLQARLRALTLMAFSNQFGHLLLATGNRSELATGYATLYGDLAGGLAPLGDLYKTEVRRLARHLNREAGEEIIPKGILTRAPTAELAPGQKDSDTLPPYPVLDAALRLLLDDWRLTPHARKTARAILRRAAFRDWERLIAMVDRADFKRRQAPPLLRVRQTSFGKGYRVALAKRNIPGFLPGEEAGMVANLVDNRESSHEYAA